MPRPDVYKGAVMPRPDGPQRVEKYTSLLYMSSNHLPLCKILKIDAGNDVYKATFGQN